MINKYSPSIFNFIIEYKNKLIIKNTLTQQYILINEKNINDIKKFLRKKILFEYELDKFPFLLKKGFFVPLNTNEIDLAIKQYERECYNNKLHLTIIPTNSCNLRCIYCFQDKHGKIITFEKLDLILLFIEKNIKKYSGIIISWFGGEPLLEPKLIVYFMKKLSEICKANNKAFYSNMTTNGVNLKKNIFRELLKYHVLQYQITIDGPKNIHDYQRPFFDNSISSFDKIIENLDIINSSFKNYTFNISIRINVSKINLPYIKDFIFFLNEKFGNNKNFSLIIQKVNDWGGSRIQKRKSILIDEEYINDIEKTAIKLGFNIEKTFAQKQNYICHAAYKNSFVIRYDLKIYKCSFSWDNEKDDIYNFVGTISNDGKLLLNEEKNNLWSKSYKLMNKCKKCALFPECYGSTCPLSNFFKNKSISCFDLFNNYKKEIVNYINYNYKNIEKL